MICKGCWSNGCSTKASGAPCVRHHNFQGVDEFSKTAALPLKAWRPDALAMKLTVCRRALAPAPKLPGPSTRQMRPVCTELARRQFTLTGALHRGRKTSCEKGSSPRSSRLERRLARAVWLLSPAGLLGPARAARPVNARLHFSGHPVLVGPRKGTTPARDLIRPGPASGHTRPDVRPPQLS